MEPLSASPPLTSRLSAVSSAMAENGQLLCHNLYLQSKQPISYNQIEAALIEQTSKGKKASTAKMVEALRSLTFYAPETQLMDVLLNALAQQDDRKLAGAVYHFLSSSPQQLRSDGLTNQLQDVLTKDAKHSSVSRRALALRTLATLGPSDNKLIDDYLMGAITDVVLKEEEGTTQQYSRRTFRRHRTESGENERPLDQAGALLAARYRFGAAKPMIRVAIRGASCEDPVGARHAIDLCLQLANLYPLEVAEGLKDLLPQNPAGRTPRPTVITSDSLSSSPLRLNLSDVFARSLFVRLCGRLAQAPEVAQHKDRTLGETYFQTLCQAVLDLHERVAFEAVAVLCSSAFPWSRIQAAFLFPSTSAVESEFQYRTNGRVALLQAVVTRIVQTLTSPASTTTGASVSATATTDSTSTRSTAAALHAACRTARLFARARILNAGHHVSVADPTLDVMCGPLMALLPQPNNHSISSSTSPSSVETGRIYIESEAMRALVWLTFPYHNTHTFGLAFGHQIRANILSPAMFSDLFAELHERVTASPDMSRFVTKLSYVWYANVPEKVNPDTVTGLWATILKLDAEFDVRGRRLDEQQLHHHPQRQNQGEEEEEEDEEEVGRARYAAGDEPTKAKALREVLLKHIFKMLDCRHTFSLSPATTLKVWSLRTRFLHFIAENAQELAAWETESMDIDECSALKAILLRLEAAMVAASWETRIVATEGMAKLAFRYPALRSQVGNLFTTESASSPASSPSDKTSSALSSSLSPAVSWVASPSLHLMELAAGMQDRGVSFLGLPLAERREAAEIGAKIKAQMSLFGTLAD